MKKKVMITGIGMLCSCGNGKDAAWAGIKAGKPGIGRITKFDPSRCSCQVAAEVHDFQAYAIDSGLVDAKAARHMAPFSQYAVAVSVEAWKDAGFGLKAPMISKPPGIASKNTQADEVSLQAVVLNLRVHAEGETHVTYIIMRINDIHAGEPAVIDLVEPIAHFRGDKEMLPMAGVLLVFRVPEKETRPGLETGVCAYAEMLAYRIFKADIGRAGNIVKDIIADGKVLRKSLRFKEEEDGSCKSAQDNMGIPFHFRMQR